MNTMRSPQQSIFKGLEGNNKDNVSGNDIIQATSEGYEDIQPKKKKKTIVKCGGYLKVCKEKNHQSQSLMLQGANQGQWVKGGLSGSTGERLFCAFSIHGV